MYSLSIDYLFNRVYDVLLWIKYVWLFGILRTNPDDYIAKHAEREFDGLRDRGWFDAYFAQKDAVVPAADTSLTLWQRILESLGIQSPDSDGDGIPNVADGQPYDPYNLTQAELKERYEVDYSFWDKVRDLFGVGPKDSDGDGVPDSYEITHGMDPKHRDTDRDGLSDGVELARGTNPLNNDSDRDLVLDGRDEAPLDAGISSRGLDTDGDGVSDTMEASLGTNPRMKDTDGDGIPDNMDTYPLDINNNSNGAFDLSGQLNGAQTAIHNPVLSFMSDVLSLVAVLGLIFLVYVIIRWFLEFSNALEHYEHHFGHGDDHHHGGHTPHHSDTDEMPAGIAGLPIGEGLTIHAPTAADFNDHPKWAIIQGYMTSQAEPLWRIGILEADNMLREVLAEKGYQGADVGEMLQSASFKTIQLAWDAHKVRNRIAHDGSDFSLGEHEAKRVYALYESVFRELKAIK
ncbi:MAG: hypothetical protein E6P95_04350 [Candidatus Moraniibacteriota bacterium]|nr:MAG: hypothetical protein E6P95_04350 [Candidatus Moranbacteria bacterium]